MWILVTESGAFALELSPFCIIINKYLLQSVGVIKAPFFSNSHSEDYFQEVNAVLDASDRILFGVVHSIFDLNLRENSLICCIWMRQWQVVWNCCCCCESICGPDHLLFSHVIDYLLKSWNKYFKIHCKMEHVGTLVVMQPQIFSSAFQSNSNKERLKRHTIRIDTHSN